jgi:hypothetical protein
VWSFSNVVNGQRKGLTGQRSTRRVDRSTVNAKGWPVNGQFEGLTVDREGAVGTGGAAAPLPRARDGP